MLLVFQDLYPSTRCIIDATEIFIQKPQNPSAQQLTFSSYKSHNTFKALVGKIQTLRSSFYNEKPTHSYINLMVNIAKYH